MPSANDFFTTSGGLTYRVDGVEYFKSKVRVDWTSFAKDPSGTALAQSAGTCTAEQWDAMKAALSDTAADALTEKKELTK